MHPEAKDLPFKGGKRHWAGAELQGRKVRKRKGNQLWQASPLGDGSPCRPLHLRRLTSQHVVGPAPSLVRHTPPKPRAPSLPPVQNSPRTPGRARCRRCPRRRRPTRTATSSTPRPSSELQECHRGWLSGAPAALKPAPSPRAHAPMSAAPSPPPPVTPDGPLPCRHRDLAARLPPSVSSQLRDSVALPIRMWLQAHRSAKVCARPAS